MLDLASSQVAAVVTGGVRLVAAEVVRPRAGVPAAQPTDADAFHGRDELGGVAPLARSDQQGQWAESALDPRTGSGAVLSDIHTTPTGPRYATRKESVYGEDITIGE